MKPKYLLAFLKSRIPQHRFYLKGSIIVCEHCKLEVFIKDILVRQSKPHQAFAISDVAANRNCIAVSPKFKLGDKFLKEFNEAHMTCSQLIVSRVIDD